MKQRARELIDDAHDHRDAGDLERAAGSYTAAAHEFAGTVEEHSFPEPDHTRGALAALSRAATCYRIAGDDARTDNRCELGTLLADDYREYVDDVEVEAGSFADLRRGAWPEFVGDLRTIAGRSDADDAYDAATAIYRSAGDAPFAYAEQEHTRLAAFFRDVKRGLGREIPADAPEQESLDVTFSEWVEYKRARLPALLDELEAQGTWPRNR